MDRFISCFLGLVLFSAFPVSGSQERPNVIVILTDDQGWGDLSLNGNRDLSTPRIDSLAKDGVSFDWFYVSAVCSPTRAEFLTGRYAARCGVYGTSAGSERINLDEKTIANVFQENGYRTGAFGKWHNGMQYPYHPLGRGFEEFFGFCSGHWGNYFDSPLLEHNGRIVGGEGFIVDDLTTRSMAFIESHRDRPFFIYLPYNTPHSPMQVPEADWNRHKDKPLHMPLREPGKEEPLHRRAALAMCENIDWNVGRLLDKLDELGLAEKTIVVYFHDNGPNGERWNGDMKGRKGSTDEGGLRSPLLMRWPGVIKPGSKVKTLGSAIDLLPTLADLVGIEPNTSKPLDGISLKGPILGNDDKVGDRLLFSHWNGKVSLRNSQFRLGSGGELFALETDPGQRVDVAANFPDVHRELLNAADRWKNDLLPGLTAKTDHRPFLVGHPGLKFTQLPARDGVATGEIKRSNRFPNDSYFFNWINTQDFISWEVEVAAPGKFEVEIYYTCPPGDAGSTLELRFGKARLRSTLSPSHDSPLVGAENDRSPRMESYTKDFRPLKLGIIELPAGPGKLELGATEKAGATIMDFRLLMMTRLD